MKKIKLIILGLLTLALAAGCSGGSTGSEASGGNRLEEIKERGYIEVATEPYFAPYEFIDPSKEGMDQYVGADMDFAQYIADDLGVDLKIVPLEFGAVLSGVSDGKYDLAISALAYTPAREEAMILSKGYAFSDDSEGYGLLIREEDKDTIKTPEDLADKTVVVQSGSLQELFLNEQVGEVGEEKKVSATTDGFIMVEESKADACLVSISMAKLYVEANPDAGLYIVEDFRFEEDPAWAGNRIGIPKGETELADTINSIIDDVVESGQFKKWLTDAEKYATSLGL